MNFKIRLSCSHAQHARDVFIIKCDAGWLHALNGMNQDTGMVFHISRGCRDNDTPFNAHSMVMRISERAGVSQQFKPIEHKNRMGANLHLARTRN